VRQHFARPGRRLSLWSIMDLRSKEKAAGMSAVLIFGLFPTE
jgi:hypothetical protein